MTIFFILAASLMGVALAMQSFFPDLLPTLLIFYSSFAMAWAVICMLELDGDDDDIGA